MQQVANRSVPLESHWDRKDWISDWEFYILAVYYGILQF